MNIDPRARQLELDMSDAGRHVYTLSTLDDAGVWISAIKTYTNYRKAQRDAKLVARSTGLPLVERYQHPGLG
jgi:ligand-binding sensor domain-containing protein